MEVHQGRPGSAHEEAGRQGGLPGRSLTQPGYVIEIMPQSTCPKEPAGYWTRPNGRLFAQHVTWPTCGPGGQSRTCQSEAKLRHQGLTVKHTHCMLSACTGRVPGPLLQQPVSRDHYRHTAREEPMSQDMGSVVLCRANTRSTLSNNTIVANRRLASLGGPRGRLRRSEDDPNE